VDAMVVFGIGIGDAEVDSMVLLQINYNSWIVVHVKLQ